jgi:hypothetical protein
MNEGSFFWGVIELGPEFEIGNSCLAFEMLTSRRNPKEIYPHALQASSGELPPWNGSKKHDFFPWFNARVNLRNLLRGS